MPNDFILILPLYILLQFIFFRTLRLEKRCYSPISHGPFSEYPSKIAPETSKTFSRSFK